MGELCFVSGVIPPEVEKVVRVGRGSDPLWTVSWTKVKTPELTYLAEFSLAQVQSLKLVLISLGAHC